MPFQLEIFYDKALCFCQEELNAGEKAADIIKKVVLDIWIRNHDWSYESC